MCFLLIVLGDSIRVPPLLVHCLSVVLAVSIILLLVLSSLMYKFRGKTCSVCRGKTFRVKVFHFFLH